MHTQTAPAVDSTAPASDVRARRGGSALHCVRCRTDVFESVEHMAIDLSADPAAYRFDPSRGWNLTQMTFAECVCSFCTSLTGGDALSERSDCYASRGAEDAKCMRYGRGRNTSEHESSRSDALECTHRMR
jgi:hypothetical protein